MTTRYLSVCLPRLPTDRLRRAGPPWSAASADGLVTVESVGGARRLAAVDDIAAARGLRPGQALADARALCPAVLAAEADPEAEADLMLAVVDWCRRFSPLVAPDGPDGAALDVGGSAHLFGGEAGLIAAVGAGLRRQGFAAHAAVASTPEAAWGFARFGAEAVVPAPSDPGFTALASVLPMAALRLDPDAVAALARVGLARVGDLLARPRGPVAARFGAGVLRRLDGLMGLAETPISPRFAAPRPAAERRFAAGLTRIDQIEAALAPLCRRLCAALARRGEGARRVDASFLRVDGAVKRLRLGTSRPTREPGALLALFRERLAAVGEDGLDTGYGFDAIRLAVTEAEPLGDAQGDLHGGDPARAAEAAMADLADRLGARLGLRRVLRLAARNTHAPEGAAVARPAARADARGAAEPWDDALCRPLRLFERPERIETIASVPDGPPVRFRWRRAFHEVAAIEGPERIAPRWWAGGAELGDPTGIDAPQGGALIPAGALTRDYFRAEDRDGRRYWLYREGLFGREVERPLWFLHGLFG